MYNLGSGHGYAVTGKCWTCKAEGPTLGYSEPYDGFGGNYCKRCSLAYDAELGAETLEERIALWNRGEEMARLDAGRPSLADQLKRDALRDAIIEANVDVPEEERFNAMMKGVYR